MDLYEVGKMLRSHYNSFLPKTYSNEDFEMRSSYADRCQMSALTLLAGLYPPTSAQVWNKELLWQPIPINSVPRDQDNVSINYIIGLYNGIVKKLLVTLMLL